MLLNQVQQPETSMGKNEKKTNAGKQGKAAVVEAEEIEQNPGRLIFVLLILDFPWLKEQACQKSWSQYMAIIKWPEFWVSRF